MLWQITRTNFLQSLPIIKQALHDCQFFAFDCEMTGLEVLETKQEYLDQIEDRYHMVRPVAMLSLEPPCCASLSHLVRGICKEALPPAAMCANMT